MSSLVLYIFGCGNTAHTSDVYCYGCDDSKLDPELPNHLNGLGMKVAGMSKTEKTMTELVSSSV